MNRLIVILAALAAITLASCGGGAQDMRIASATQETIVTPVNPNGWSFFEYAGGTVDSNSGAAGRRRGRKLAVHCWRLALRR